MRCEEVMKRDVECCGPDESAQDAACKMRDRNVGFLPVCGDDRKVIGTITDRDLAIRVLAEGIAPSTKASELMTREAVWCLPNDDLRRAEELMAEHHKSRILVCDESGTLRGVISLSDLAQKEEESRVAATLKQVTEREAHP